MDQHDPASTAQPERAHATPTAAAPAPRRSRRRRRTTIGLLTSGAVAAGLVLGGSAVALGWPDDTSGTGLTASAGRDGSASVLGGTSG
jgi:anti-sigma factor RsiW